MDRLFCLCEHQIERIKPFFPKSRGVRRVEGRKMVSGSIHVQRHRLRPRSSPQPPNVQFENFLVFSVGAAVQIAEQ